MNGISSSARDGRVSVEAIVSISIATLAVFILGLKIAGHAERGQPETAMVTRPHAAMSMVGEDRALKSEDGESETMQVVDGVTVLTPTLLVPVVHMEDLSAAATASSVTPDNDSPKPYAGTKRHRRHVAQNQGRAKKHFRIVGLAANRRMVSVGE